MHNGLSTTQATGGRGPSEITLTSAEREGEGEGEKMWSNQRGVEGEGWERGIRGGAGVTQALSSEKIHDKGGFCEG